MTGYLDKLSGDPSLPMNRPNSRAMSQPISIESMKALLALDAEGALVPHGLGGHGRACLASAVEEIEKLRSALGWYGEKAKSLAEKDWRKHPSYAEAIFTELSLDAGRRAGL